MRHRCLLIFWIIITLGCSIKYLYVFIVSDWTSLEDWVSISYLAFYTVVTLVVISFTKECGTMVLHQLIRLEEILYNLCYHLPMIYQLPSKVLKYTKAESLITYCTFFSMLRKTCCLR